MALILNNSAITKSMTKMVELRYGYIFNGHYYDKKTMTPKPLTLFPTYGDPKDLCLNKRVLMGSSYLDGNTTGSLIITDDYNPEITFVFSESTKIVMESTILKLSEKDNDCELIMTGIFNAGDVSPSYQSKVREYIGQNKDYIFVICGAAYSGLVSSVIKINKMTLETTIVVDMTRYGVARKVAENSQYIYVFNLYTGTALQAYRIDKFTNTSTALTVTANTGTSTYRLTTASNGYLTNPGEYLVYTLHEQANQFKFYRRIVDTNDTNVATCAKKNESVVTIDYGEFTESEKLPCLASATNNRFHLEISKINDKVYLNVYVSDCLASNTANIGLYGIYTYEINPTTYDLTFVGSNQIRGIIPYGFVISNDKQTALAICNSGVKLYKQNVLTGKFDETMSIDASVVSGGFDLNENIWYEKTNGEVEMVSPTVPLEISLRMEQQNYQYNGTDIVTKLFLSAKNYNKELIQSNVNLSIKGSATFVSTGTKLISIQTLVDKEVEIPMIIKDGGQFIIYPEFVI